MARTLWYTRCPVATASGIAFQRKIGVGLLWASAILTLYTGYDYMRAGLRYMIDEDV